MRTVKSSHARVVLSCIALAACDVNETDPIDAGRGSDASTPPELDAAAPAHDAGEDAETDASDQRDAAVATGPCALDDGQCIFRHDTFGDEQLWTDVLKLNELVQTLSPTMALAVGLKVDGESVPAKVLASADLTDPATTVALLELNAVVGVRATVSDGQIVRMGITCALCHSSVDNSVMPGVGKRLDGWPNRELNAGAILALTPGLASYTSTLGVDVEVAKAALNAWGPGKYDARFNQDKQSHPVLIPPAYGLEDVALETYTGEGPISYWNAYVAVTQMGAQGNFSDERLGLAITHTPDLVTAKLPALRDYQFSLRAPEPPPGSFDAAAAARGKALFESDAQCATCHGGASFTDAPTLHAAAEIGAEPIEAERSVTGKYRTTPLKGLFHRAPYFHDGSAQTLPAVAEHYDEVLALGLSDQEKADLVEYLKSL
jgi:mono/diheme cytochrome c family protein